MPKSIGFRNTYAGLWDESRHAGIIVVVGSSRNCVNSAKQRCHLKVFLILAISSRIGHRFCCNYRGPRTVVGRNWVLTKINILLCKPNEYLGREMSLNP